MAFAWDPNLTPATGSVAIFALKALLKLQGWTVTSSGDGLAAFSAVGDVITSSGAGANGLANPNAWFCLQSPAGAGALQIVMQRGPVNREWRAKIGPVGGFVIGPPTSTRTPEAAFETAWIGGGTDAVPTFAVFLGPDGGFYRWNLGADNAAPYGFWAQAFPVGGGLPGATLILDPLVATAPGDAFPYLAVMGVHGNNLFGTAQGLSTETNGNTTIEKRLSYVAALVAATAVDFTGYTYCALTTGINTVPSFLPTNPLTVKDEVLPIPFGRRSTIGNAGWKGVTSLLKWVGTTRATGDTLTVAAPGDRLVVGTISLNWPTGVVPVV